VIGRKNPTWRFYVHSNYLPNGKFKYSKFRGCHALPAVAQLL
jgi:hypothetical protein